MTRRCRRTTLLILAAALLGAVLTLGGWLRQHPEVVTRALNARLPAGVRVREMHGPRLSLSGGRVALLALDVDGATLHIEDAHWSWRLAGIWPPQIDPRRLGMGLLVVRLAPPTAPGTPLLPRFWLAEGYGHDLHRTDHEQCPFAF